MRRRRFFFRPCLFRLEDRNAPVGHAVGLLGDALSPALMPATADEGFAPLPDYLG